METKFDVEIAPIGTRYYTPKGEAKHSRKIATITTNGAISFIGGEWTILEVRDLLITMERDLMGYSVTTTGSPIYYREKQEQVSSTV